MAVNAYLIIEGRPGPSTSKKGAIDILSFSFGVSQVFEIGRAGKANFTDLTVMKVVDQTSPLIFDDCATGNLLKKVDIIYDKPMGDEQQDYWKIHLDDAYIKSVQYTGSAENPVESISFAFLKVKVSYNPEEGGVLKGFVDKGFDLLKLKPW